MSIARGRIVAEETTYTYDDHGQLLSSRTIREPEWLDTDWWLAQALELYEAGLCPDCRQPRGVAWHPDQDGWYEVTEQTCHGCGALAEWAKQDRDPPIDRRYKLSLVDTRPSDRPLHLPPPE